MTKSDVIDQITQKKRIDREKVYIATEAFFNVIRSSLIEGKAVYLRGFGTFSIKKRRVKTGIIFRKILRFIFLSTVFLHLNLLKSL
jgi:nucleoid DNA-binding protein